MGLISYNTPAIADAVQQIAQAAAQTEQNHADSVRLLTANAAQLEGGVRGGFEHALSIVNQAYDQSREAIHMASQAVSQASQNMVEKDAMLRAQYG
jgi:uncharacterized protein YukE